MGDSDKAGGGWAFKMFRIGIGLGQELCANEALALDMPVFKEK